MKSWDCLAIRPSLNELEAGPGRSMANCVTKRKLGPPFSQPLSSRGFEAFQDEVEWLPLREWTLAESENGWRTKPECDYRISPFFFSQSKLCWQTHLKEICGAFEKWIQSQLNECRVTITLQQKLVKQ